MKPGAPDPAAAGSAPTAALAAYGALGLPLAFAALPIYVHVPRLYTEGLDLSLALPVLGAGMVGLLAPPAGAGALWLFALLVLVSLAYSVATIAYNAWGAEVGTTPTSANASRLATKRVRAAGVAPTSAPHAL